MFSLIKKNQKNIMTDVDKLKALFKIAEKNGWKTLNEYPVMYWSSIDSANLTLLRLDNNEWCDSFYCESLNDIVGDWELNQTSFLEALIFAELNISAEDCKEQAHHVRTCWFKLPSSLRLEYLFETFKSLIE